MDKEHTKALEIKGWLRCLEGCSHQEAELSLRKQHYLEDKNKSILDLVCQKFLNMEWVFHSQNFSLSFLVLCFIPQGSPDLNCSSDFKPKIHIFFGHLQSLKLLSKNAHDLSEGAGFLSDLSLSYSTYWTFAVKHNGPVCSRDFLFTCPWINLSSHFLTYIQKQNKTFK